MISGHVHLLSILSWGILVYQTSMSFCCTSFYNAGKFSEAELVALLENPDKPIFVFELEGQVVGHLFCEFRTTSGDVLEPIKTLFIDDLCVASSVRGQKIGEQLYEFALSYAKEQGCHNLTLDVWADNAGAVHFYERQGLKPQKFRMEQIIN